MNYISTDALFIGRDKGARVLKFFLLSWLRTSYRVNYFLSRLCKNRIVVTFAGIEKPFSEGNIAIWPDKGILSVREAVTNRGTSSRQGLNSLRNTILRSLSLSLSLVSRRFKVCREATFSALLTRNGEILTSGNNIATKREWYLSGYTKLKETRAKEWR